MIAEIRYTWYEGESGSCIITHQTKTQEEFEKDLQLIRYEINREGHNKELEEQYNYIRCVPTFFNEVLNELELIGYTVEMNFYDVYSVDDISKPGRTICTIQKKHEKVEWKELPTVRN